MDKNAIFCNFAFVHQHTDLKLGNQDVKKVKIQL